MNIKFWKSALLIGFCLFAFLRGESPSFTPIQDKSSVPILTPSFAHRETTKLRLSNGLEAYLISDPKAIQAGAVLTVQAGSWDDPESAQGIAHFVEHMLFLGTEKYPIESDYDHFIRLHNGNSNAYTASDYTLYLFSVDSNFFEEGLDRFSSFFKKPLFNPSGTDRELNAIDQEFAKNFSQDKFREHYVQKELANVHHPFHQFSIGNRQTLSKVTPKILRDWYQEHYSANHMRLIIYAPQPLETLKTWAVQYFKEVPSNGKERLHPQVPVYDESLHGKMVYIQPIRNMRSLHLSWEIPISMIPQGSFQPDNFMSMILGDEGAGSLLSNLKKEGLADYLTSGGYRLGKNHFIFSLHINLTPRGLEKTDLVMERCFQVIQELQKRELPTYLFDEYKKIQIANYQYQSRKNVFSDLMHLGGLLVYEDISTFPESVMIPGKFDHDTFYRFLNYLTPQNVYSTVLTRHPAIKFDQKEKWMGVNYKVVPLSLENLKKLNNLHTYSQYQFPSPNPYVPNHFKILPASSSKEISQFPNPILLVNNEQGKIYFAQDGHFQIPQTIWFFEIKTPSVAPNDPEKIVMAELYIRSLQETLQPFSYPAEVANLSYHVSRTPEGILLSVSGYNDTAETLFNSIIEHLKKCQPSKAMFQYFKNSLLGQYFIINQEGALEQGFDFYQNILFDPYISHQQLAKTLEKISYESFLDYVNHLYDQTYTEGLLYGDINQEQANEAWNKLNTTLNSEPFKFHSQPNERVLSLPDKEGPYLIDLNVQNPSHAIVLGIEEANFSYKNKAAQQILAQTMESNFYSTLRTKQQTCYLLFTHADEIEKHLFTFFGVQSTTHDPRDLLARFELFIEDFLVNMENNETTKENFEKIRLSLLKKMQSSPGNLEDAGHLLQALAFKHGGDFNLNQKEIQGFKDLTYEEFLEFSKNFLGKQNKRRLALLIRGTTDNDFRYRSLSNLEEMREISKYTQET